MTDKDTTAAQANAAQASATLQNVAPAPVTFWRKPKPFDREAARREYEKEHPEAFENRMKALRTRHAGTQLKVFKDNPRAFFVSGFQEILATRMAGLPIVNTALSVWATDFVRIEIDEGKAWFGVVVTPWAVMAILTPASREGWRFIAAGGFEEIELAAGDFRFIACADDILGHYRSLSLQSPVFEFRDMASARAFADTCLNVLLGREELKEEAEEQNPLLTPAPPQAEPLKDSLTRRELLGRYTEPLLGDGAGQQAAQAGGTTTDTPNAGEKDK